MEKEKKNLNIEKLKTLKTSQNDKLFLKKKKKKGLTLPGLGRIWPDLDYKFIKILEKKSKMDKIDFIKLNIPLFYVILLSVLRISAKFREKVAE